jgi:hypothetical protein
MPDRDGNFKGIDVPAEAWDRIFGVGNRPAAGRQLERIMEDEVCDFIPDHSMFQSTRCAEECCDEPCSLRACPECPEPCPRCTSIDPS